MGGLLAALGSTDHAVRPPPERPLAVPTFRAVWELKVPLVAIFVYTFFKFAWSYRLFNYCSILFAYAPLTPSSKSEAETFALRAARFNTVATKHFNRGRRGFFCARRNGMIFPPIAFMIGTGWVIWILFRREFRSRSHYSLKAVEAETQTPAPGRPGSKSHD